MALQAQEPKSAYQSILEWSDKRPEWQRDALRRIVLGESLTADDIANWERQCCQKHGVTFSGAIVAPIPLDATHIPASASAADAVSLVSVGSLKHVNRLPTTQTLSFGTAPGLTVAYGDNGCGKSGYARVIKKACRSRGGVPSITHNVFDPKPTTPATGTIKFSAGGTVHTASWEDGKPSDPRLANVFVFDATTASHYLAEDSPACFTPRGLDVLPTLSKVCDALRKSLNEERGKLTALNVNVAKQWQFGSMTAVGALIASLSASTEKTRIAALATLSDTETTRLSALASALASNPRQKAKETRASASRLRGFSEKLKLNGNALAETNVKAIESLMAESASAKRDATEIATKTFAEGYLTATGQKLWRSLWEGARSYSQEAYPKHEFPLTDDDLRCLLCQQPMTADTRERLQRFERFCKDTTQKRANELVAQLTKQTQELSAITSLKPILGQVETDLGAATEETRFQINAFVDGADAALDTLKLNLKNSVWNTPASVPVSPSAEIDALVQRLEEQAKTEEDADDPKLRQEMVTEQKELTDRQLLAQVQAEVEAQVDRHKQIAAIDECLRDCATNAITSLNTELSEKLINEQYRRQFKDEITRIGVNTIDVALEDIRGQKGTTTFGLRLVNAKNHHVRQVASEGEQRCLALAAFLAELTLASHKSALVFDDPVSSLDFTHCRGISERLAEEAKVRQVIVFTHNVVFLNDLRTAAEDKGVTPEFRCIEWEGASPGACRDGLPWLLQRPKERLDYLEKDCASLAKVWNPIPNDENKRDMGRLYGRLRAVIERVVEVYVLDNSLTRFDSYVQVGKLRALIGFTKAEFEGLYDLFRKASNLIEGHDGAAGKPPALPTPKELRTDIDALRSLMKTISSRNEANKK